MRGHNQFSIIPVCGGPKTLKSERVFRCSSFSYFCLLASQRQNCITSNFISWCATALPMWYGAQNKIVVPLPLWCPLTDWNSVIKTVKYPIIYWMQLLTHLQSVCINSLSEMFDSFLKKFCKLEKAWASDLKTLSKCSCCRREVTNIDYLFLRFPPRLF